MSSTPSPSEVSRAERRARLDALDVELVGLGLSDRERVVVLAGAASELPESPTASGLALAQRAAGFVRVSLLDVPTLSPIGVRARSNVWDLAELPASWRRRLLALVARRVAREIRALFAEKR